MLCNKFLTILYHSIYLCLIIPVKKYKNVVHNHGDTENMVDLSTTAGNYVEDS